MRDLFRVIGANIIAAMFNPATTDNIFWHFVGAHCLIVLAIMCITAKETK